MKLRSDEKVSWDAVEWIGNLNTTECNIIDSRSRIDSKIRFQRPPEDYLESSWFKNLLVFIASKKINHSEGNTIYGKSNFMNCYSQAFLVYNEPSTYYFTKHVMCMLLKENILYKPLYNCD